MTQKNTNSYQTSVIHQKENGFWSRLHEVNKPLTMKEVSDNLKNYAIAGTLYAGGVTIINKGTGAALVGAYSLTVIAVVFFAITLCQSWVLAQKLAYETTGFNHHDLFKNGLRANLKFFLLISIPLILGFIVISTGLWYARHTA